MKCKHCNTEIIQTETWGGMDYIWKATGKNNTTCKYRRHEPQTESQNVNTILKKYE